MRHLLNELQCSYSQSHIVLGGASDARNPALLDNDILALEYRGIS